VIARVENFLICKAAFEKALFFGQNVAIECCFAAIVSGATEERAYGVWSGACGFVFSRRV
jgi:hypothetical protein